MSIEGVMLDSFLEAAIWSTIDENDLPFDENFSIMDFSGDAFRYARGVVKQFLDTLGEYSLSFDDIKLSPEQIGYDLWLTKEGHGAGFWDRGLVKIGDTLTTIAQSIGTDYIHVIDGELHFN